MKSIITLTSSIDCSSIIDINRLIGIDFDRFWSIDFPIIGFIDCSHPVSTELKGSSGILHTARSSTVEVIVSVPSLCHARVMLISSLLNFITKHKIRHLYSLIAITRCLRECEKSFQTLSNLQCHHNIDAGVTCMAAVSFPFLNAREREQNNLSIRPF